MNWFKHSVDSHDDPDISDAEDLFGDAGYTIFFKIIELYAREYNNTNSQGEISFSLGFLRRKLRKSSAKVELILNFYSKKQRIIFRKGDGELIIKIPKFIDILDNWSKRKVTKTTEQLQSKDRATTQPIRREEEKNKEEKKNKDSSKKKKLFTDNGSAIQVPLAKNGSSVSIASSISVSNASSISASKKKNEKFIEESRTKKIKIKPIEKFSDEVLNLELEFSNYINKNRVESVFSKYGEINEPKEIGLYIGMVTKDAIKDFEKDFKGVKLLSKKETKFIYNASKEIVEILNQYL